MPTSPSQRRIRSHPSNWYKRLPPEQQTQVLADRRERRDSARMGRPALAYPPERRAGQYAGYVEIHDAINGWTKRYELRVPSDANERHARVDSRTLMVDGAQAETGGWHALFRYLVKHCLPRPHSLRAWATLER